MGCLWSSEEDRHHYPYDRDAGRRSCGTVVLEASYGEYRCTCGNRWTSRKAWHDKHQLCKKCKRPVMPRNLRKLQPSDWTDKENRAEHAKELCQMCQQLGRYCGNFRVRSATTKQYPNTRTCRR